MAGSVSKTLLIGNVGGDPEIRNNGNGGKIVTFSVATSESWRDKDSGERKERTEWHRIVVFDKNLADFAEHHVRKGLKVYIEGQNRTRKWEKDGHTNYTTEVVLQGFNSRLDSLERLEGSGRPPPPDNPDDYGTARERPAADRAFSNDIDDDIPF